jgi:hypothetical protein
MGTESRVVFFLVGTGIVGKSVVFPCIVSTSVDGAFFVLVKV